MLARIDGKGKSFYSSRVLYGKVGVSYAIRLGYMTSRTWQKIVKHDSSHATFEFLSEQKNSQFIYRKL